MINEGLWSLLDKLKVKCTKEWKQLNYIKMPVTVVNADIGNEKLFNELYQWLLKSNFKPIKRTPSGGISVSNIELLTLDKYDVQVSWGCCEITICTIEGSCRVQFRCNNYEDEDGEELFISGKQSFNIFKKELKKTGINIEDYAVDKETGLKINETIMKPDIRLIDTDAVMKYWQLNPIYDNAHHIDFHKFYMSGLKLSHPEMAPAIDRMAEMAKSSDPSIKAKYKTAMAATIGYFHSKYIGYKYAQLAKDAIETAYKRYYEVFNDLSKTRHILATNTDGIWYQGEIYHNSALYEGEGLTEWNNDHINCTIRFKSKGSYEFMENGTYYPIVRGRTRLDEKLPRDQWQWGFIFLNNAAVNYWKFEEGVGIVWEMD